MVSQRLFVWLSLVVVTTAAWSTPPAKSRLSTVGKAPLWTSPAEDVSTTNNRRGFLIQTTVLATSFLQITTAYPQATAAAAATTQETALTQWQESVSTIDNLLENWSTISAGGGDAIRKELGTANFGKDTSPLFQIDKAFKVLREKDDVDLIEFTEQSEEFSNALARADTMAYSANFAGGSGKPTPPQVYIDKAKKEVEGLQQIAKSLSSLL
mmetsp:Transcript_2932/g.3527  ORF Transcript_2932/g.3527 Transcript_2932/m.3527 type:complete len:212 (-) Transcript_2932:272-907(-)